MSFGIIATIISCKKDNPTPDNSPDPVSSTDTLEQNELAFLNYWFFDDNSHWIFQEDSLGYIDTLTIAYSEIKPDMNLGGGNPNETDGTFYVMNMYHSASEIFGNAFVETRSGGYRVNHSDWAFFQNFGPGGSTTDFYDNYIVFTYPYNDGDSIHFDTQIIETLTLTTPAGTFENTVHVNIWIKSFYDTSIADYITDLYLSPGIGVTRMKTGRGFDIKLIDYYIP